MFFFKSISAVYSNQSIDIFMIMTINKKFSIYYLGQGGNQYIERIFKRKWWLIAMNFKKMLEIVSNKGKWFNSAEYINKKLIISNNKIKIC